MRNIRFMALLAGVSLLGPACGSPEPEFISEAALKEVTFEEFQATAYDEPDSDVFVINGDEAVVGTVGLREYYDRYIRREGLGTREDALTAYCLNGTHVKWTPGGAGYLTYCVSSTTFGSRYTTVVNAMNAAAAAWEAEAQVNFVHLSQFDSNCTASQTGVLFDVRQVVGAGYPARSFFPNASRSTRNLLIDSSAFGTTYAPWTLPGILRHELGHILGFRHEYIRSTINTCYEDTSTACALTSYDPYSVMNYRQCGGANTGDLILTPLDKAGVRAYYPFTSEAP